MANNVDECHWFKGTPGCRVDKRNIFFANPSTGDFCPYCGRKVWVIGNWSEDRK